MEPDFHTCIAEESVCFHGVRNRAAPPVIPEDCIVNVLHPQFDLGHAILQHPVYVLPFAPVRAGLKRDRHTANGGCLVGVLNLADIRDLRYRAPAGIGVHRLDTAGDEFLLVLHRAGGHGPAHHDQFHLLHPVPEDLELPEPGLYLPERIEVMLASPFRRRLLTRIALRGVERVVGTARAGQALTVRAGVGRSHHGNRGNPGECTGGLDH